MLSSTIDESYDINTVIKRFLKKLDGCIAVNFKKMRVNIKARPNTNRDLYDKMRHLKTQNDPKSKTELDKVKEAIANIELNNFNKLKEELIQLKTNQDKSRHLQKLVINSEQYGKIVTKFMMNAL